MWSASPSGEMKNMIGWKVDICMVGKKSTNCPGEVTRVCLGNGIFMRFAHYGPKGVLNRQKRLDWTIGRCHECARIVCIVNLKLLLQWNILAEKRIEKNQGRKISIKYWWRTKFCWSLTDCTTVLCAILTRTYLMHVIVSAAKSPTRMERRPKRRLSKCTRLRSLEYSLRS